MSRTAFSSWVVVFCLGLIGLMREIDLHHWVFAAISGLFCLTGLVMAYLTWRKTRVKIGVKES